MVRRARPHLLCRIGNWFLVFIIIKSSFLFVVDQHGLISFLIADVFNGNESAHTNTTLILLVAFVWLWLSLRTYQKINLNQRDAFWLTLLPFDFEQNFPLSFPKNQSFPKKLAGMQNETFTLFQQRYLACARWIVPVMDMFSFFGCTIGLSMYIIPFHGRFKDEPFFWPVVVFNSLPFYIVINLLYFMTMAMPLNFVYFSFLLRQRFRSVCKNLSALSQQVKPSTVRISLRLREFNLVVQDLLKVNRFWAKIFGLNYFFAILYIFLLIQNVMFGDVFVLRITFAITIFFLYFGCILIPVYIGSEVHSAVR